MRSKLLSVMLLVLVASSASAELATSEAKPVERFVMVGGEKITESMHREALPHMALMMSANMPRVVDTHTILQSASVVNGHFRYNYTILVNELSSEAKETLGAESQQRAVKTYCKTEQLGMWRELGTVMEHEFKLRNGDLAYFNKVDPAVDC